MIALQDNTLLIASQNLGKVQELQKLLTPHGISVKSALDLDLPEPEETGKTLKENARLKALYYGSNKNVACLADDSGLMIHTLNGWPGVHTKDFADPTDDYAMIREKLGDDQNQASMVCVLCLRTAKGEMFEFEGKVEGQLVFPPRGQGGFGVDPIFQPAEQPGPEFYTFGERPDLKQNLSHRARAFAQLLKALFPHAS